MRNEKVHSMLMALVGGYVLYLAYQLLQKYISGSDEMPGAVFVIAIAVLTIGGIGSMIYAWTLYRKSKKEAADSGESDGSGSDETGGE